MNRRHCLQLAAAVVAAGSSITGRAAPSRAVIIYYSRTGNTARLADRIANLTGADVIRLEVREPYASDYGAMTDIARREVRTDARRELATVIPDLSVYDTIFLGTPYWWGGASVPVNTFLQDHALAGKTVFPFVTSASSSPDGAVAVMKRRAPKARFMPVFHATDDSLEASVTLLSRWCGCRQEASCAEGPVHAGLLFNR